MSCDFCVETRTTSSRSRSRRRRRLLPVRPLVVSRRRPQQKRVTFRRLLQIELKMVFFSIIQRCSPFPLFGDHSLTTKNKCAQLFLLAVAVSLASTQEAITYNSEIVSFKLVSKCFDSQFEKPYGADNLPLLTIGVNLFVDHRLADATLQGARVRFCVRVVRSDNAAKPNRFSAVYRLAQRVLQGFQDSLRRREHVKAGSR